MDKNRQKTYMKGIILVIISNYRDAGGGNMKFDRFDAKILDALQRDGRLSVVDLAESIGLSPTPCARRIKALESEGAIEGYAAVLNPARVGLAVLAIVQVKLTEHTDETVARFEREIQLMDEVTKCLAMTGSYDFILEVYGKDLEALSNVVLKKLIRVPNVRDMQSSVVLETIKRTARIPLAHLQT
jgi:Lrp/AsnC family transcriptional regulator, leucine-responsive regulatory protein